MADVLPVTSTSRQNLMLEEDLDVSTDIDIEEPNRIHTANDEHENLYRAHRKAEKRIVGQLQQQMRKDKFEKWYERLSVFLVYVGGYQTVISIANLSLKFGPSVIIPVCLFTFVVGLPVLYLEYSLGQFTSLDTVSCYRRISPVMGGIGISSMLLQFLSLVQFQPIMVAALHIAINAMGVIITADYDLPKCFFDYNDPWCNDPRVDCRSLRTHNSDATVRDYKEINSQCMTNVLTSIDNHITKKVHHHAEHNREELMLEHSGLMQYMNSLIGASRMDLGGSSSVLLTQFHVWIFLLVITLYGMRFIAKLSVWAQLFIMAGSQALAIICFFLHPLPLVESERETDENTLLAMYSEALLHVVLSMRLGQGGMVVLGSFNRFHNNALRDCLIATICFIILPFSYGYLSERVMKSYLNGATISANEAVAYNVGHYLATWSVFDEYEAVAVFIYATTIVITIFMQTILLVLIIYHSVREQLSVADQAYVNALKRMIVMAAILFQLYMYARTDEDLQRAIEHVYVIVSPLIVLFEVLGIVLFYGPRKLFVDMNIMLFGEQTEKDIRRSFWKRYVSGMNFLLGVVWTLVIPFAMGYTLYYQIGHVTERKDEEERAMLIGICVVVLISIPIVAAYQIGRGLYERVSLRYITQPDVLWGPSEERHRKLVENEHRRLRMRR